MKCEEVDLTGFLNSELDAEDTRTVAEHLEGCPDCHDRLMLLMEMRQNRAELKRFRTGSKRSFLLWPVAAAVAALLLLGVWIGVRSPGIDELAVATPYPLVPPELRSGRENSDLLEAAEAYSRRDWPLAEQRFKRYLSRDSLNYDAAFYLANVEYMMGKYSESEQILTQLQGRNTADDRVRWYLANTRIKLGNVAGAKPVLETLAKSSGEYSSEAMLLLRKMSP